MDRNKIAVNFIVNVVVPRARELGYFPIYPYDCNAIVDLFMSNEITKENATKLMNIIHDERIKELGESYVEIMKLLYSI